MSQEHLQREEQRPLLMSSNSFKCLKTNSALHGALCTTSKSMMEKKLTQETTQVRPPRREAGPPAYQSGPWEGLQGGVTTFIAGDGPGAK